MVPSLAINEEVGTQYCVICRIGSGETTEVDKINLLLNAFANLSVIIISSSISLCHS